MTPLARSPSAPVSTARTMDPSEPRKTLVLLAMRFLLLAWAVSWLDLRRLRQVHDHLHVVDAEGRLQQHRDEGEAGDLLLPRGRDGDGELGQCLVQHHVGEE